MIVHWHADPVLLTLGPLALRWYGLLFVGAFMLGQAMLVRMLRAEGVELHSADRLLFLALIGTIVGARLVHCLFYDPAHYLAHPLEILRVWEGGLASHGGAAGLFAGLWIGSRSARPPLPFLWLLDRVTLPAALGAVFVRVANFVNSEIVGLPTSGRWGVVFDAVDPLPRHPVQLYEAAAYLLVFGVLAALYRRHGRQTPRGLLLGVFLLLVFSARIALEFFKTPQAAYEAGQVFSVGQWLSLPFVLFGAGMIAWSRRRAAPQGLPETAAGPR